MINFFRKKRLIVCLSFIVMNGISLAYADTSPPSTITTPEIAVKVAKHYLDYTHFKIIGECQWLDTSSGIPVTHTTLELDEYLPDLIVTVFNHPGDDPWFEAATMLDSPAQVSASVLVKASTGYPMETGHNASQSGNLHADHLVMKEADVIGNPETTFQFPFAHLDVDTDAFMPYYQSSLDMGDRSGTAELWRPESFDPFDYYIGPGFYNHWGYEFPRSMSVNIDNDYKSSIVIALHAADIVTNKNTFHTVQSTEDSCGKSCAVANVIEEMDEQHAIWQEVYPNDRHIQLGEDDSTELDSLGEEDEAAGNGNYVFVVWRHYKGCQQAPGKVIYKTVSVSKTKKR